MKKFIITIDTEGDNQWEWYPGSKISTQNTMYLPRFQELSNSYGFKPVWLTNYEMIMDPRFIEFARDVIRKDSGEIGMHLHAWNTPPYYELPIIEKGAPYLIEYPYEVMEQKIDVMTKLITEHLGVKPISHRAGRWAMDDRYFSLLSKYGYQVDCSVTPHNNWSKYPGQTEQSAGSDYSDADEQPKIIGNKMNEILEVPVTIRESHMPFIQSTINPKRIIGGIYMALKGQKLWLRPNGYNRKQMIYLIDRIYNSDSDYIMFMLHSSEMMPGGSPRFKTQESIENMYRDIDFVFKYASRKYEGITLKEYARNFMKKVN